MVTDPPNATEGGANEADCSITTGEGPLFHAIKDHGDIEGWEKDIFPNYAGQKTKR